MPKKIKAYPLEGRKYRFEIYHEGHADPHYIDAVPKPTNKLKTFARNQCVTLVALLGAAGVVYEDSESDAETAPAQQARAAGKPWLSSKLPDRPGEDDDPNEFRRLTGDMRIDVPTLGMVIPQGPVYERIEDAPVGREVKTKYAELVTGPEGHPEAQRGPEDWPKLPNIDAPGKKVSRWGIMGRTAAGEMIIRSKARAATLLKAARAVTKKEHRTAFSDAFAADASHPSDRFGVTGGNAIGDPPLSVEEIDKRRDIVQAATGSLVGNYINEREEAALEGDPEPKPLDCDDCAPGALGHPSGYSNTEKRIVCKTCKGTGKKPETQRAEKIATGNKMAELFKDSKMFGGVGLGNEFQAESLGSLPTPPSIPEPFPDLTGSMFTEPKPTEIKSVVLEDVPPPLWEIPLVATEPTEAAINAVEPNAVDLNFCISARKRTGRPKTYDAVQTAREAIEAAIADNQAGAFLEWGRGGNGPKLLSVLDVDWHGSDVPDSAVRNALILSLQPQPILAWLTDRGIHAIYENREDYYTGEELAGAAAVWLYDTLADTPAAPTGIEVLTRCRCPKPEAVCQLDQTTEGLRGWLRLDREVAVDPAIDRYCTEHGISIGNKYSAVHCPSGSCGGSGTPVAVLEDGIKCHRCAGHGRGPNNCGYWSWNRLVGKRRSSQVREMARAWVYADHAARVLAESYPFSHRLLRAAWQCFLKTLYEPKDPRVALSGKHRSIVRGYDGTWRDIRTLIPYSNQDDWRGKPVSGMPSIHFIIRDDKGVPDGLAVDNDQLAKLRSTAAISGWPCIMPSYGGVLWGVHNEYSDNYVHAAPWPTNENDDDRPPMFCYIPPDKRELQETADAWDAIEDAFPEINIGYLKLLIVAKAYAESGVEVPMLFILGPSGAGKTLTAVLAALLCGERPEFVTQLPKVEERVGQALMRSGMVVFDDLLKQIPKKEVLPFLSKFLSASGGGVYEHRQPYMPFISTRIRSALVFTDTNIPEKITHNLQIGRRFIVVDLASIVPQWRHTAGAGGVYAWTKNERHRRYADLIVSEILDTYTRFDDQLISFTTIATKLGFSTVAESVQISKPVADDSEPINYMPREIEHHSPNAITVRELFAAILGKKVPTIDSGGRYGDFWLEMDTDPSTATGMFWHQIAEGPSVAIDEVANAIDELDIGAIIGAPKGHPVTLRLGTIKSEKAFYFAMAKKPGGNLRASRTLKVYNAAIPNGVTATPTEAPEPTAFAALANLTFLGGLD